MSMSDVEFYSSITKWQTGQDMVNNQNCFALNFEFNGELPFASITLKLDIKPNIEKYGLERYYKCFYVFVGGTYVDDLEKVINIVEDISDQFHGIRPIALFVIGKFDTSELNKFSLNIKDLTMVYFHFFYLCN